MFIFIHSSQNRKVLTPITFFVKYKSIEFHHNKTSPEILVQNNVRKGMETSYLFDMHRIYPQGHVIADIPINVLNNWGRPAVAVMEKVQKKEQANILNSRC